MNPLAARFAESLSRGANGQYLSMRRRIGVDDSPIVRTGDDAPLSDDHCSDRHVTQRLGLSGEGYRLDHVRLVLSRRLLHGRGLS